jgi:hypothetical protein
VGKKGHPAWPTQSRKAPGTTGFSQSGDRRPTGCSNRSAGDRRNNSQPPALDQRRPLYSRANNGALCGKVPRGPSSTTSDGPFLFGRSPPSTFCVATSRHGHKPTPGRGAASMIGCDARHTSKIWWERVCTYALSAPSIPNRLRNHRECSSLLTEAK